ncbi:hypothetical protein CYY_009082 [Polysphondylium violaceum]|uniref:USP domain-containing protein n=1 Tax=Polysphondylium violaceum TaxID=133409 RepID=A0A8J4UPR8_9MYCE|nr:hypothetical protein CYY_009082 [Polysphondylium violaceum]
MIETKITTTDNSGDQVKQQEPQVIVTDNKENKENKEIKENGDVVVVNNSSSSIGCEGSNVKKSSSGAETNVNVSPTTTSVSSASDSSTNNNNNNNNPIKTNPSTPFTSPSTLDNNSSKKQIKDTIDFSKYYRDIESSLRNETSPISQLENLIQIMNNNNKFRKDSNSQENLLETPTSTPTTSPPSTPSSPPIIIDSDQMHSFLQLWLPKYIISVLSFKSLSTDIKPVIIEFLKTAIQTTVDYMSVSDYNDLWASLCRILYVSHPFYSPDRFPINKDNVVDMPNILKPKIEVPSLFYFQNVVVLVESNYLNKLLTLLSQKPPLFKLKLAIKSLYFIREYFTISFLNGYLIKLKESLFNYLLDLFYEDLPPIEKENYKEIYQSFQHLLAMIVSQPEIARISQEFDLNRALKCFQSVNLEKKLRGIRYIKKESAKCIKKESDRSKLTNFLKTKTKKLSSALPPPSITTTIVNNNNNTTTTTATSDNNSNAGNNSNSSNSSNQNNSNQTNDSNIKITVTQTDNNNTETISNSNNTKVNINHSPTNSATYSNVNNSNSNSNNNNNNNNTNNNNQNNNQNNPQLLYEWIIKNEIIENCCKLSDQPDIMRHCIPVMIFLTQYGQFNHGFIDLLWSSSLGKHESVKNMIFMAILEIVSHLCFESVEYLYNSICKTINILRVSEFDNEFLSFLFNFATLSIQHSENFSGSNKKLFGLEIFWRLSTQQCEDASERELYQSLCIRSRNQFISLLKLQECTSMRTYYLECAIENLKNNTAIVESLDLIINIIDPKKQKSYIEILEQKYKIFDLFFKEISNYKKVSLEKSKLNIGNSNSNNNNADQNHQQLDSDFNNTVFVGQFPHLTQIHVRIQFLEFILSQSNFMLNIQQVDILWDSLVTNALTIEERESCFLWLKNTKISGQRSTLSESVVKHLFLEKMSNMDWYHLGPSSFSVYERFFFFLNEKAGKLKKIQSSLFNDFSNQLNGNNSNVNNNNSNGNNNNNSNGNSNLSTSTKGSTKSSPMLSSSPSLGSTNSPSISPSSSPLLSSHQHHQQIQQEKQAAATTSNSNSNSNNTTSSAPSSSQPQNNNNNNSNFNNDFSPSDYFIASIDLMGIKYLWSIALDSISLELSDLAINTLINLYQSGEGQKSSKYKEEFIKICLENITKNLDTMSSPTPSIARDSAINRVCRALTMLKIFKNEPKKDPNTLINSNSNNSNNNNNNKAKIFSFQQPSNLPNDRPLTYLVKFDRGDAYTIGDIYGTDTLRMFKRKVANFYGNPKPSVKSLKIYVGDKEFKDDDKAMEDYKIFDSNGLQIYPLIVKRILNNNTTNSNSNGQDKKEKKSLTMTTSTNKDQKKKNDSISNEQIESLQLEEDDEEIDVLDDTPIASMVIESLQHQLGGFGLIGDLLLRKVQTGNPNSTKSSKMNNLKNKNEDLVANLLTKTLYFEKLFNLLNLDDPLIASEKAWDVLSDLPFSDRLLKEAKSLRDDLPLLFPSHSVYRTLHSLKLLEHLMIGNNNNNSLDYQNISNNNDKNSNNSKLNNQQPFTLGNNNNNIEISPEEFKNNFVNSKQGIEYILNIFTKTPISCQKGTIKLFGSILKLLSFLTLQSFNPTLEKPIKTFGMQKKNLKNQESMLKFYNVEFLLKLFNLISTVVIQKDNSNQNNNHLSEDIHILIHYGLELFTTIILTTIDSVKSQQQSDNTVSQSSSSSSLSSTTSFTPSCSSSIKILKILKWFDWEQWLRLVLLECSDRNIQIKTSNALLNIATNFKIYDPSIQIDLSLYFLSILLSFLPQINQYYSTAEQYFCLLSELLNIGYPSNSSIVAAAGHSPLPLLDNHKRTSSSTSSSSSSSPHSTSSLDLQEQHPKDKDESLDFVKHLLSKLIHELKNIQAREVLNVNLKDHILNGFLNVIRNLVKRRPSLKQLCQDKELVEFLFTKCLFQTPVANDHHGSLDQPPLCKVKESRISCFRLLTELCRNDHTIFYKVVDLITNEIDSIETVDDWNYSPLEKEKSVFGYVGLKNQGATCYMNSILQQLYYSPLCKGITSLSLPPLINPSVSQEFQISSNNSNSNSKDNTDKTMIEQQKRNEDIILLTQLQLLFVYLQESSKKYYDPYFFCRSIKSYNGAPINLSIQMDAYEFLFTLLEKLEDALKKLAPQDKDILKETFGGTLANQIISKECTHRSTREEPFFSVSVDIKNKKSIIDSFYAFIDEDNLVGDNKYKCESCDSRVDAIKRTLIDRLPNTLVVQLKRFEYDLDNMRNNKLNDYIEFPTLLDIEPFTLDFAEKKDKKNDNNNNNNDNSNNNGTDNNEIPKEKEKEKQNYKYILTGIILHQGTADYGHYISLIRDKNGYWFELNDTLVQPYDWNRIPIDCFGGFDEVRELDKDTQKYVNVKRPKTCNAYMLFYTKYQDYSCNTLVKSPSSSTTSTTSTISKEPLNIVWKENHTYLKEKFLFDLEFGSFVWDIVNLYHNPTFNPLTPYPIILPNDNSLEYKESIFASIKLSTKFLIDIYSHSKEKRLIDVWGYHIKRLLRESVDGAEWFLNFFTENKLLLKSLLVSCVFDNTKSVLVDIITYAVLIRKNIEPANREKCIPSILNLCNTLMTIVKCYKDHSRRAVQKLFQLLINIVQHAENEREYLLEKGIISKLIDTFIGTYILSTPGSYSSSSPFSSGMNSNSSSNNNGNGNQNNNINTLNQLPEQNKILDLISFLVRFSQVSNESVLQPSQLNNYPSEKDRSKPRIHIFRNNYLTDDTSIAAIIPSTSSTRTNVGFNQLPLTYSSNTIYTFSESTFISILSKAFLIKAIKENGWFDSIRSMIKHLCWENKMISSHFLNVIKETLLKSHAQLYINILSCLNCLLEMQDSIATWRIENFMSSLIKLPDNMIYNQEGHDVFLIYLGKITGTTNLSSSKFDVSHYHTINTTEFTMFVKKNKDAINVNDAEKECEELYNSFQARLDEKLQETSEVDRLRDKIESDAVTIRKLKASNEAVIKTAAAQITKLEYDITNLKDQNLTVVNDRLNKKEMELTDLATQSREEIRNIQERFNERGSEIKKLEIRNQEEVQALQTELETANSVNSGFDQHVREQIDELEMVNNEKLAYFKKNRELEAEILFLRSTHSGPTSPIRSNNNINLSEFINNNNNSSDNVNSNISNAPIVNPLSTSKLLSRNVSYSPSSLSKERINERGINHLKQILKEKGKMINPCSIAISLYEARSGNVSDSDQ